jgi:hypothetical protein
VARGGGGDGRGSGRRGTAGAAELGASLTSQVEGDTVPDAPGSRSAGCGEVGWTKPTRASAEGDPPDEKSLTVTTAVVVKGDDVYGVAATAGMNRRLTASTAGGSSVPRTRGDEPVTGAISFWVTKRSPHQRG